MKSFDVEARGGIGMKMVDQNSARSQDETVDMTNGIEDDSIDQQDSEELEDDIEESFEDLRGQGQIDTDQMENDLKTLRSIKSKRRLRRRMQRVMVVLFVLLTAVIIWNIFQSLVLGNMDDELIEGDSGSHQ